MAPMPDNSKENSHQELFLCGVVEGFYGRPWTTEQRKDLFTKLQAWGTNSYLYAPKDDCKHRAYWREPYTVDEAEHLGSLISLAADCNIDFYYAISPGLDITYSSPKEVTCLKRKLEQVAQLGCKAFALLFDDIEPEMCKQDKEVFQSFAHAQVSVTNEIFQHLGQPKFLFCPTQYCTARAVPTVRNSEYLITIGSKLAPEINIMWTGDKVISKIISDEHLEDINDVLKRKCVIWDNEHANDYDQKRVFMGPYSGRSPEVKSKLSGVMTNPNCEYGANFIAIHTLAQWNKCNVDGTLPTVGSDAVSSDIKLENETDESSSELSDLCLPPNVYHPRHALINSLKDWLPEFSRQKTVWGPMSKPQVGLSQPAALIPGVTTCMASTTTTNAVSGGITNNTPDVSANPAENLDSENIASTSSSIPLTPSSSDTVLTTSNSKDAVDPSALQPITLPVMNSLVSTNKVVVDASIDAEMVTEFPSDAQNPLDYIHKAENDTSGPVKQIQVTAQPAVLPKIVSGPTYTEPMECVPDTEVPDSPMESTTNPPTPMNVQQDDGETPGLTKAESTTMLCDSTEAQALCEVTKVTKPPVKPLCVKDLLLLCQMFYLPADHGQFGLELLNEFYWLKRNGTAMLPLGAVGAGTKEDREEWQQRATKFDGMVQEVVALFEKLCSCQNRELVYDLYTYLWDMCSVLLTLNGFVHWLARGCCTPKLQSYVVGQQTWFSGIREAFQSGDHEPWVFRGGLISDLLRLLPLDSGHDLYIYKYPEVPLSLLYLVRPYDPKDQKDVYALAAKLFEEEIEVPMGLCDSDRIVVGDKSVGAFVTLMPEYCFVVESTLDNSIVAFASTAPDASQFLTRHNIAWVPEMREKYPRKIREITDEAMSMLSPIEEMMLSFHTDDPADETENIGGLPACLSVPAAAATDHLPAASVVTTAASNGNGCANGGGGAGGGPATLPWGLINLYITPAVQSDQSVGKRLAMLSMACLRASGTIRAYSEIRTRDIRSKDLYTALGFALVTPLLGSGVPNNPTTSLNNDSPSSPSTSGSNSVATSSGTESAAVPVQGKYIYLTRSF